VKARPFTERLPTLDAWNIAVQRSITATISVEVAYVGNKGTHTLSDGDGNNTNPNEAAIFLPAAFHAGVALHYDYIPADVAAIATYCTTRPMAFQLPGRTREQPATELLQRYTNGNASGVQGPCGWTSGHLLLRQMIRTPTTTRCKCQGHEGYTKGLSINLNYAYAHATDAASNFATWDKASSHRKRQRCTTVGLHGLRSV
jgi:hypothetical protein